MTNGTPRTLREEVLEIIREMPGVTLKDIADLLPHRKRNAVSAMLTSLHVDGEVLRKLAPDAINNFGRKPYLYRINPDPKPPRIMQRKHPSAAAYEARIAELEAKVQTLSEWKAAAIERFPDLGVDPITAEARRIVATEIEAAGDKALAAAVRAGTKDSTLPMRVTLAALQR